MFELHDQYLGDDVSVSLEYAAEWDEPDRFIVLNGGTAVEVGGMYLDRDTAIRLADALNRWAAYGIIPEYVG